MGLATDCNERSAATLNAGRFAVAANQRGDAFLQSGAVPGGDHPLRAAARLPEPGVHCYRRRQHRQQYCHHLQVRARMRTPREPEPDTLFDHRES